MKKFIAVLIVFLLCATPAAASEEFFTILLMGMDEGGEQALVDAEYGRTDAMMLASISKTTGRIRLLSVERDYMIDLPMTGPNKLCIVCYLEGPKTSVAKVNELFDLDVKNYALIDPKGIEEVIDAIGGIELEIKEEDLYIKLAGGKAKAFKKAGVQHVNGAQVRAYVRTRTEDSDAVRNERQYKTLTAAYEKALHSGMDVTLKFIKTALPCIETNVNMVDILSLAISILSNDFSEPERERSPMTDYQRKLINLHQLVVLDDPEAEIQRVHDFLYGN